MGLDHAVRGSWGHRASRDSTIAVPTNYNLRTTTGNLYPHPSTSFTFAPIVAGLSTTWMPHSLNHNEPWIDDLVPACQQRSTGREGGPAQRAGMNVALREGRGMPEMKLRTQTGGLHGNAPWVGRDHGPNFVV